MSSKLRRLFVKQNGNPSLFAWFLLAMLWITALTFSTSTPSKEQVVSQDCLARGGVFVRVERVDGKTPTYAICLKKDAVIE